MRLEKRLQQSYLALTGEVADPPFSDEEDPTFHDYLALFSSIPVNIKGNRRLACKLAIRSQALGFLFQGFMHGICPGWADNGQAIFDIHDLQSTSKNNIVRLLTAMSYKRAFNLV